MVPGSNSRYDVPGTPDLGVRVFASAFDDSLYAAVTLTNSGTRTLALAGPRLNVSDARAKSLPARSPGKTNCPTEAGTVSIPPGQKCTFSAVAQIQPLVREFILRHPNPDLDTIRLAVLTTEPSSASRLEIPMVKVR